MLKLAIVIDVEMKKIKGPTTPTLIGCLRYVASHRPSIVMLENVPKVRILLQALVDIVSCLGYHFVDSQLDSSDLGVPNARPPPNLHARHTEDVYW